MANAKMRWLLGALLLLAEQQVVYGFYDAPRCFRELHSRFFTAEVLYPILSLHEVPQSQWEPILTKLQARSKDVPNKVRELARRLSPNPLENPFQKKEAEELLKKVLLEIFEGTLRESNVFHTSSIQDMFEDIWLKQAPLLNKCLF